MSTPPLPARLATDIRRSDALLTIGYRLTNETKHDLWVFNKFCRIDKTGKGALDDRLAYVIFEDDQTVHVTRSALPIPEGVSVEYPELPYVTLLAPGKTLAEQVEVPLPAREYRPYLHKGPSWTEQRHRFENVHFSIGVVRRSKYFQLRECSQAGKGIFVIVYSVAMEQQCLLKSSVMPLTVPALVAAPPPAAHDNDS
jgi:hypothetical protein